MRINNIALSLVNIFFGAVEAVLGLRFVLKLLGANTNTDFVNWIYEMSGALLDPFRGIFPTRVFENRFVIEFSTLFAMVIYAIAGMLLMWLVAALTPKAPVVVKKTRR